MLKSPFFLRLHGPIRFLNHLHHPIDVPKKPIHLTSVFLSTPFGRENPPVGLPWLSFRRPSCPHLEWVLHSRPKWLNSPFPPFYLSTSLCYLPERLSTVRNSSRLEGTPVLNWLYSSFSEEQKKSNSKSENPFNIESRFPAIRIPETCVEEMNF